MNSSNSSRSASLADSRGNEPHHRGFTLVELMVLLGIIGVMASIFVPYAERIRESDRRARCYDNLMHLAAGLRDYAAANGHYYPATRGGAAQTGYTCFTGVDEGSPFTATSTVRPNDVTASLWLLVRLDLANPSDFICPSTDDSADPLLDSIGRTVPPSRRGNFRSSEQLSYSYASPFSNAPGYRLNDTRPPEFALIADRNPGPAAAFPAANAPPLELSVANSANHHQSGQNVLYADGHAEFSATCYCGRSGDNIYTALRASVISTAPSSMPSAARVADGHGVSGRDVSPAWDADSYLVPTANDIAMLPAIAGYTVPLRRDPAGHHN